MARAVGDSILKFDKFWVIWGTSLDAPRTVKDVQRIWGYEGNALYQKGLERPILEEMIEKGFVKKVSKVKMRGVSGLTIEGNFDWVPDYLEKFAKDTNLRSNNPLILEILDSIGDKKALLRFIKDHRQSFYFIERVELLFGNKESLKSNYDMLVFAPILTILNIYAWKMLQKRMGIDENITFFLTSTFIFNMNPKINFLDYFLLVAKDFRDVELPSTMFDQAKVFSLWKRYSVKMKESLFL